MSRPTTITTIPFSVLGCFNPFWPSANRGFGGRPYATDWRDGGLDTLFSLEELAPVHARLEACLVRRYRDLFRNVANHSGLFSAQWNIQRLEERYREAARLYANVVVTLHTFTCAFVRHARPGYEDLRHRLVLAQGTELDRLRRQVERELQFGSVIPELYLAKAMLTMGICYHEALLYPDRPPLDNEVLLLRILDIITEGLQRSELLLRPLELSSSNDIRTLHREFYVMRYVLQSYEINILRQLGRLDEARFRAERLFNLHMENEQVQLLRSQRSAVEGDSNVRNSVPPPDGLSIFAWAEKAALKAESSRSWMHHTGYGPTNSTEEEITRQMDRKNESLRARLKGFAQMDFRILYLSVLLDIGDDEAVLTYLQTGMVSTVRMDNVLFGNQQYLLSENAYPRFGTHNKRNRNPHLTYKDINYFISSREVIDRPAHPLSSVTDISLDVEPRIARPFAEAMPTTYTVDDFRRPIYEFEADFLLHYVYKCVSLTESEGDTLLNTLSKCPTSFATRLKGGKDQRLITLTDRYMRGLLAGPLSRLYFFDSYLQPSADSGVEESGYYRTVFQFRTPDQPRPGPSCLSDSFFNSRMASGLDLDWQYSTSSLGTLATTMGYYSLIYTQLKRRILWANRLARTALSYELLESNYTLQKFSLSETIRVIDLANFLKDTQGIESALPDLIFYEYGSKPPLPSVVLLQDAFEYNPFVVEFLLCRARLPDIATLRMIHCLPIKDAQQSHSLFRADLSASVEHHGDSCHRIYVGGEKTHLNQRLDAMLYVSEFGYLWGSDELHRTLSLYAQHLARRDGVVAGVPMTYYLKAIQWRCLEAPNRLSAPLDFLTHAYLQFVEWFFARSIVSLLPVMKAYPLPKQSGLYPRGSVQRIEHGSEPHRHTTVAAMLQSRETARGLVYLGVFMDRHLRHERLESALSVIHPVVAAGPLVYYLRGMAKEPIGTWDNQIYCAFRYNMWVTPTAHQGTLIVPSDNSSRRVSSNMLTNVFFGLASRCIIAGLQISPRFSPGLFLSEVLHVHEFLNGVVDRTLGRSFESIHYENLDGTKRVQKRQLQNLLLFAFQTCLARAAPGLFECPQDDLENLGQLESERFPETPLTISELTNIWDSVDSKISGRRRKRGEKQRRPGRQTFSIADPLLIDFVMADSDPFCRLFAENPGIVLSFAGCLLRRQLGEPSNVDYISLLTALYASVNFRVSGVVDWLTTVPEANGSVGLVNAIHNYSHKLIQPREFTSTTYAPIHWIVSADGTLQLLEIMACILTAYYSGLQPSKGFDAERFTGNFYLSETDSLRAGPEYQEPDMEEESSGNEGFIPLKSPVPQPSTNESELEAYLNAISRFMECHVCVSTFLAPRGSHLAMGDMYIDILQKYAKHLGRYSTSELQALVTAYTMSKWRAKFELHPLWALAPDTREDLEHALFRLGSFTAYGESLLYTACKFDYIEMTRLLLVLLPFPPEHIFTAICAATFNSSHHCLASFMDDITVPKADELEAVQDTFFHGRQQELPMGTKEILVDTLRCIKSLTDPEPTLTSQCYASLSPSAGTPLFTHPCTVNLKSTIRTQLQTPKNSFLVWANLICTVSHLCGHMKGVLCPMCCNDGVPPTQKDGGRHLEAGPRSLWQCFSMLIQAGLREDIVIVPRNTLTGSIEMKGSTPLGETTASAYPMPDHILGLWKVSGLFKVLTSTKFGLQWPGSSFFLTFATPFSTPLILSAQFGSEVCQYICKEFKGRPEWLAYVNHEDGYGLTALQHAIILFTRLVEQRSECLITSPEYYITHLLATTTENIKALVSAGADPWRADACGVSCIDRLLMLLYCKQYLVLGSAYDARRISAEFPPDAILLALYISLCSQSGKPVPERDNEYLLLNIPLVFKLEKQYDIDELKRTLLACLNDNKCLENVPTEWDETMAIRYVCRIKSETGNRAGMERSQELHKRLCEYFTAILTAFVVTLPPVSARKVRLLLPSRLSELKEIDLKCWVERWLTPTVTEPCGTLPNARILRQLYGIVEPVFRTGLDVSSYGPGEKYFSWPISKVQERLSSSTPPSPPRPSHILPLPRPRISASFSYRTYHPWTKEFADRLRQRRIYYYIWRKMGRTSRRLVQPALIQPTPPHWMDIDHLLFSDLQLEPAQGALFLDITRTTKAMVDTITIALKHALLQSRFGNTSPVECISLKRPVGELGFNLATDDCLIYWRTIYRRARNVSVLADGITPTSTLIYYSPDRLFPESARLLSDSLRIYDHTRTSTYLGPIPPSKE
ncbi:hypothetical protein GMRT_14510 [Giardia muris]|uniref:Uncharacterized protein n=1 Tax=Giardia muris TaxID=5742 RepID=A0A4Z1T9P0_GIAMU|nr:hypothetical protein GMRT_14510 [Giardia muris]|eukprot:TNJ29251.1 hypothetical protein GMRT_14510 [Giardia muris]